MSGAIPTTPKVIPLDQLRTSELRYRRLFEAARDGIFLLNVDSLEIFEANPYMSELLGYAHDEFLGKELWELGFFEDEDASKAAFKKVQAEGYIRYDDLPLETKNGESREVEFVSNVYDEGDKQVIQCNIRDITERKHLEHARDESDKRYQALFEYAPDGIVIASPDNYYLDANPSMCEMLGYAHSELIGMHAADIVADTETKDLDTAMAEVVTAAGYLAEWLFKRKDWSRFTGEVIARIMPDGNLLAMVRDITGRKAAQKALSESNDNFSQLANNITDAFWIRSPDMSEIHYISPAFEVIWGVPVSTYYKHPESWLEFIVPEDRAKVSAAYAALMKDSPSIEVEYRITRPDGETRWIRSRGFQVRDDSGQLVRLAGIITDLTEKKRLEDQFLQSQKLESVGRLAGGIAHDFNNMLTAINGYSELVLRRMAPDDPVRKFVEEIKKAGERSALLTHQLLAFSRRQILQPQVIRINDVINDTSNLLKRLIGEDVELATVLKPEAATIEFDPGQLGQILMNLAVNARDAMPTGGKLTIATSNVFIDPNYANFHIGLLPGAYVLLSVSDNGVGIAPEVMEHIFEPFFTTKGIGQGTGLGLATVYGIVKQSGGGIFVYSEPGHGTTFKVYIPRVATTGPAKDEPVGVQNLVFGSERILLVEDEEVVRSLSREVLEACGYTVVEAQNGVEALEIVESGESRFDLVITDVVMPQMGGPQLAERLREIEPDLPVLFSSGYTDDAIVRHGVLDTNLNFLQKPFTIEEVARKVRELLDAV